MTASIPSPSANGIHLGPFFVHAYGLAYVAAVLAAVAITSRRWERQGGDRALVREVALWGFPAGLVGGRLYFLATSWDQVPDHWWGPLAIWNGGLGIWGGIAAGSLVGMWVLRRRGADIARFLDAAAPALLVAQSIGRVVNYFNQELFGGPTNLPWALHIDLAHRPPGYEQFTTFHPTFLYEILWNLALAALLVWLGRRRSVRPPGLFALYVAGYSGFRIFEELLRVDPAHHVLGLRLNLYVATILCLAGALWFLHTQGMRWPRMRRRGQNTKLLILAWAGLVVCGAIAASLLGCGGSSSNSTTTGGGHFAGTAANPPKTAPPLALEDSLGHEININDYRGEAVLVTFIYTHCPDVCPLIVGNLHTAQSELGPEAQHLQIIAVSVDPKGDTRKTVNKFLKDHQMTGRMEYLIGSRPQLEKVWKPWFIHSKAAVSKRSPDLVEHSALVYGVSASGKITTLYPANFVPHQIVHDVPILASS